MATTAAADNQHLILPTLSLTCKPPESVQGNQEFTAFVNLLWCLVETRHAYFGIHMSSGIAESKREKISSGYEKQEEKMHYM